MPYVQLAEDKADALAPTYMAKATTLSARIENAKAFLSDWLTAQLHDQPWKAPYELLQEFFSQRDAYDDLPQDVKNTLAGIAGWKHDAERDIAEYRAARQTSGVTATAETQAVETKYADAINSAGKILTDWHYVDRDADSYSETYKKELPKIPPPDLWPTWLKWAVGIVVAVQILQVTRK